MTVDDGANSQTIRIHSGSRGFVATFSRLFHPKLEFFDHCHGLCRGNRGLATARGAEGGRRSRRVQASERSHRAL